jgi:hypothetical protein
LNTGKPKAREVILMKTGSAQTLLPKTRNDCSIFDDKEELGKSAKVNNSGARMGEHEHEKNIVRPTIVPASLLQIKSNVVKSTYWVVWTGMPKILKLVSGNVNRVGKVKQKIMGWFFLR